MKELSIEQKAKQYDEALKITKNLIGAGLVYEDAAVQIFPELKENEDERIRKKLIALIEWSKSYAASGITTDEAKEMTAWLEKQGDIDRRIQEEIEKQTKQQWKSERQDDNVSGGCNDTALEKQGEQKPVEPQQDMLSQEKYAKAVDECVYGEQKPINKIQIGKMYKCIASPRYSTFVKGLIYRTRDKFLCSLMNFYSDCFEPIEDGGQKSTEWSEEDTRLLDNCINLIEDIDCTKEEQNFLKSLKNRIQPQSKHGWSEEDDNKINSIKYLLHELDNHNFDNWLESLKERVQPKQEWSEEDKEFINDLIGVFDGQQYQAHSDEEIVKWLKSIRLPYNKEWDENDEEMLKSIIATCELACEDRDSSPAKHLLEMQTKWLKSLKDRYTWKPSDEQMVAVQEAMNIVGILTITGSKINSLYQDLKKLK